MPTIDTWGTIPLKERSSEARDAYYEGFNAALVVGAEIADRQACSDGIEAEAQMIARLIRDKICARRFYRNRTK